MSKPTLEQLKYYVDADLKLIYDGIGGRIVTLETVRTRKECLYISTENGTYEIGKFKPLLRPMSDLTRKLTIEGEEKIPIVCLAEIAFPDKTWHLENNYAISFTTGKRDFIFIKGEFISKGYNYNSIQLFQWLFKHKFDVFGLIESGAAIDVNTLTENIY